MQNHFMTGRQKQFLLMVSGGLVLAAFAVFMIQQLRVEGQLDDIKRLCAGLKLQSSLDEVRFEAAFAPGLQMTLLEPTSEGSQIGSIYYDGTTRGGCAVTFMKGRLIQKSFFLGSKDPTKPSEKLKPW